MKINLKFLLKSREREVVSIPRYIFLFVLLYLGYFVVTFIGYSIFYFSYSAIMNQEFVEPNNLSILLLVIIGLLSFFTINKNLRFYNSKLKKSPVIISSGYSIKNIKKKTFIALKIIIPIHVLLLLYNLWALMIVENLPIPDLIFHRTVSWLMIYFLLFIYFALRTYRKTLK